MRRSQSRAVRTQSGTELGGEKHRALSPSEMEGGAPAQVRWRVEPGIELAWRKDESRSQSRGMQTRIHTIYEQGYE